MAPKVHFIHGLESGPGGRKVRHLRARGYEVTAPDMRMSMSRLDREHSVARNLLRGPTIRTLGVGALAAGVAASRGHWRAGLAGLGALAGLAWSRRERVLARALSRSFEQCLTVQRCALLWQTPDIIVGSSWGGAVALELIRRGDWRGPTILLAPAYLLVAQRAQWTDVERRVHELMHLAQAMDVVINHDPSDDVIPFDDNASLSALTGIPLESVDAGGHSLPGVLESGSLDARIRAMAGTSQ